MNSLARITALTTLAAGFSATAQADQILVDLRGFGDATTLQEGVDLAAPGDVIVVYPGQYNGDVTVDEGVWIVAQQAGTVEIRGSVMVRDVVRGQQVVLMDLLIQPPQDRAAFGALDVVDTEGLVQVSNCSLIGGLFSADYPVPTAALRLRGARRVNIMNTPMTGAFGNSLWSYEGGHALTMVDSRAAIWGSTITGGQGLDGTPFNDTRGPGNDAIKVDDSELFLSGAQVRGGEGGKYQGWLGLPGEPGGDGISSNPGGRIYLVNSTVVGGAGGFGSAPSTDGVPFSGSGQARFLPGAAEVHDSGRFAFAQSTLPMTVRGDAGKSATLYLTTGIPPFMFDSLDPGPGPLGVPSLALSNIMGPLGQIPPNGQLQTAVNIPALPTSPGILPATFFVVVDGGRRALFGAPLPVVGLNCATLAPDCDGSGMSDFCEIVQGLRPDMDNNGQVDGCGADCNGNGVPDWMDLSNGTSTDLNGNWIPDDCEPATATWYVDPNAGPGGLGTQFSPFATIAEAAAIILPGHEVILQDGIHQVPAGAGLEVDFANIALRSANGQGQCIVQLGRRALSVRGPGHALVQGITFRGGFANLHENGGVLAAVDAELFVSDCSFDGSQAGGGGAISVEGGGTQIRRCSFANCSDFGGAAEEGGGALRLDRLTEPGAIIDECVFTGNEVRSLGGAVQFYECPLGITVSRCRFFDNGRRGSSSFVRGGAMAITRSRNVHIAECIFALNSASEGGAIYSVSAEGLNVSGCTFTQNEAVLGSVMATFGPGNPMVQDTQLSNSILWGNSATAARQITLNGILATIEFQSCNVEGGLSTLGFSNGATLGTVAGLIDSDPLFVNISGPDGDPVTFADNDYTLLSGSPSVDAGDNGRISIDTVDADGDLNFTEPSPFDVDGNPRRADDPATPDSGAGTAPLVDHGASER